MIYCNLKTLLIKHNLTQKQLSELTKINKNTIGKYINNTFESVNKNHMSVLCSLFCITTNELFEFKSDSEFVKNEINSAYIYFNSPDFISNSLGKIKADEHIENLKIFLSQNEQLKYLAYNTLKEQKDEGRYGLYDVETYAYILHKLDLQGYEE